MDMSMGEKLMRGLGLGRLVFIKLGPRQMASCLGSILVRCELRAMRKHISTTLVSNTFSSGGRSDTSLFNLLASATSDIYKRRNVWEHQ
jgi:hypothetical protein